MPGPSSVKRTDATWSPVFSRDDVLSTAFPEAALSEAKQCGYPGSRPRNCPPDVIPGLRNFAYRSLLASPRRRWRSGPGKQVEKAARRTRKPPDQRTVTPRIHLPLEGGARRVMSYDARHAFCSIKTPHRNSSLARRVGVSCATLQSSPPPDAPNELARAA